ncbi:hypothetical protein [Salinibacter ruber]|uniref:Post-segregation antitoxin (Ccd killing protein) n=1 Tax=Salinibacter ruber TaxID=146919 RepID=A0A9X2UCB6_9BACT|nr:hypothetical protein [Salinibacter ruber]MCS3953457.1 post-segregation antitoxin (ccd killing protein) [Salinibacter ruber]
MRITVRVPDDLGDTVKSTTENVSAYVTEALREKIARDRCREARQNILDGIRDHEGPGAEGGAEGQLHEERRESDWAR